MYLGGREDVKNKPLVVLGQSYAAQLAIYVAAKYPEQIDALITEGVLTSFRDIAVYSTPWIGKPFTWTFFSNPYSAVNLIQGEHADVLVDYPDEFVARLNRIAGLARD